MRLSARVSANKPVSPMIRHDVQAVSARPRFCKFIVAPENYKWRKETNDTNSFQSLRNKEYLYKCRRGLATTRSASIPFSETKSVREFGLIAKSECCPIKNEVGDDIRGGNQYLQAISYPRCCAHECFRSRIQPYTNIHASRACSHTFRFCREYRRR